jgi:hypothetical protein
LVKIIKFGNYLEQYKKNLEVDLLKTASIQKSAVLSSKNAYLLDEIISKTDEYYYKTPTLVMAYTEKVHNIVWSIKK